MSAISPRSKNPHDRPSARTDLLIHRSGDCWLLADPSNSRVHSLNPTAMWIWHHCTGHSDASDLAHWLAEEADIPVQQALVDVTTALRDLRELGLLELA